VTDYAEDVRILVAIVASAVACAGELAPRPNAEAYPVRASASTFSIGAEFAGRGVMASGASWPTGEYLSIEVGAFPERDATIDLKLSDFSLRINGEKVPHVAYAATMVAASVRNTGLARQKGLEVGGGVGPVDVVYGRPRQTEPRFPGDPGARQPMPPPAPQQKPAETEPQLTASEAIIEYALPLGETRIPVAGFLYFHFEGKASKIRTLELLYKTERGEVRLKLL